MNHLRPKAKRNISPVGLLTGSLLVAAIVSCSSDGVSADPFEPDGLACDLDTRFIADGGVGRDGIPALTNPIFIPALPVTASNRYVSGDDRVLAIWLNEEWVVIPHAILYRHEIVNLDGVAVTYCPLTGTGLAFSRASVGGAELGVSGLLYQANLILYDRNSPNESLWPQMLGEARCGPRTGQTLTRVPLIETRYEEWLAEHPDSKVLAITPGLFSEATYLLNPYGESYESPSNGDFLGFPMPEGDVRLRPKDRVLGIPDATGGPLAYAFRDMRSAGLTGVWTFDHSGESAVVIWNDDSESAGAYFARVDGVPTPFSNTPEGVVDDLTGTLWSTAGTPLSGDLVGSGTRLEAVPSAYVSFWLPWAAFHPGTELAVDP